MDIVISDITLKKTDSVSFNEKTETVKLLDSIGTDVIELPRLTGSKADILFLHTVSSLVKNSVISCETELSAESVENTAKAISAAKRPRLLITVPVSPIQMEYVCGKKPHKVLEMIKELTEKACALCKSVEVSFADATRAEREFLLKAVDTAVKSGAQIINICDDAGTMLPVEFEKYVNEISGLRELGNASLSVEANNSFYMAAANTVSAVIAGANQVKVSASHSGAASLSQVAQIIRQKQSELHINMKLDMTKLENAVKKIEKLTAASENEISPFDAGTGKTFVTDTELNAGDSIEKVSEVVKSIGYELSDKDLKNVYEEFKKAAANKSIGAKELDAIISWTAMQVPPAYKIKSYVINSGNILTPTANIEIYKDEKLLRGFCVGDGPIDAAFLAIEKISGHHYELDDFRIKALTGGYEAMGFALVKLRHNGKLFSGSGISTDIVGASINAYINALNKICWEEGIN